MNTLPVIDFKRVGLDHSEADVDVDTLKEVCDEVKEAFTKVGFCYLKNHGVGQPIVDSFLSLSKDFFESPDEEKRKYVRKEDSYFGWMALESEKLNPNRPGDLKESFNYIPYADTGRWYSTKFQEAHQAMFKQCSTLTERILDGLSMSLDLDRNYLKDLHKSMGKCDNNSWLRSIYYPPLDQGTMLKPGQIRLGEHTDYGVITMLFQDEVGGLEVDIPGTGFVPATPIPGTIVLNIGSMMQRWTSDRLIATTHRVLIPEVEFKKKIPRQSVAFYVQPDVDTMITCLDGSNKYPPILSRHYLEQRFKAAVY